MGRLATPRRTLFVGLASGAAILAAALSLQSPDESSSSLFGSSQELFEVVPGPVIQSDSGVLSPELRDVVRVHGTYVGLSDRGRAVVRLPSSPPLELLGDRGGIRELEPFAGGVSAREVLAIFAANRGALDLDTPMRLETLASGGGVDYGVLESDAGISWTVLQKLSDAMTVTSVHPNYVYRSTKLPGTSVTYDDWGFAEVGAPDAWSANIDASKVVVAVVDSGLSYGSGTDDCISSNLWSNRGEVAGNGVDDDGNKVVDDIHGANFVDPRAPTGDIADMTPGQHGTAMARLIGESCNDWNGHGIAPQSSLMIVAFLDKGGTAGEEAAARAVDYAVSHMAKIINVSWSREQSFEGAATYTKGLLKTAIQNAVDAGALLVFGVGGTGDRDTLFSYPSAWQVAAGIPVVGVKKDASPTQAYGCTSVVLGAPGEDIHVGIGGQVKPFGGSSPAAAFVSGSAALTWAKLASTSSAAITAADVRGELLANAVGAGTTCSCKHNTCWSHGTNRRLAIGFLK